jgi:hypothetical protein
MTAVISVGPLASILASLIRGDLFLLASTSTVVFSYKYGTRTSNTFIGYKYNKCKYK